MKTSTERVREFRERMRKDGMHEVRGIYAPKDQHAAIKAVADALIEKGKRDASAK